MTDMTFEEAYPHREVLAPKHSKKSCSDENASNYHYSENGTIDCVRCAFIAYADDFNELTVELHVTVTNTHRAEEYKRIQELEFELAKLRRRSTWR